MDPFKTVSGKILPDVPEFCLAAYSRRYFGSFGILTDGCGAAVGQQTGKHLYGYFRMNLFFQTEKPEQIINVYFVCSGNVYPTVFKADRDACFYTAERGERKFFYLRLAPCTESVGKNKGYFRARHRKDTAV